jgi:hypothetical protein
MSVKRLRKLLFRSNVNPKSRMVSQWQRKYSEWQCSRVTNKSLKMEYQKVYQITLSKGLNLELIYEE